MFKRLFPVFLVLVLLAGLAPARPAGVTRTNLSPTQGKSNSLSPGYNDPRLDFGTVVRDTADEQGLEPGHDNVPSILRQQDPRGVPGWHSFFAWSWLVLLLVPR